MEEKEMPVTTSYVDESDVPVATAIVVEEAPKKLSKKEEFKKSELYAKYKGLIIAGSWLLALTAVAFAAIVLICAFPVIVGVLWVGYGCVAVIVTICTIGAIWWGSAKGGFLVEWKDGLSVLWGKAADIFQATPVIIPIFAALGIAAVVINAIGVKKKLIPCIGMLIASSILVGLAIIIIVIACIAHYA